MKELGTRSFYSKDENTAALRIREYYRRERFLTKRARPKSESEESRATELFRKLSTGVSLFPEAAVMDTVF